jgi:hypothetical protein
VIAAFIGACEQGIPAGEGERADRAVDGVVAEIDAAIVEEADLGMPGFRRRLAPLQQSQPATLITMVPLSVFRRSLMILPIKVTDGFSAKHHDARRAQIGIAK